ncbi:glycosyltransferase family 2 protein [Candidatus Methylopumilus planktonicus]|uniref:glycosyltransferase family 2 protein n=1 Tax=Candidatus Methylopumilus planktonicus TaxID=1581557 RepID=UPI003BEF23EB
MQTTKLPISVIIPCYNCSASIDRAIKSVMEQIALPSEIILIDDCSDDSLLTIKAIRNYQKKYKNLNIVILQMASNKGPANARNEAWNHATQPYLAFLDADDAWHPKKLSIQYAWMKKHPEVFLTAHNSNHIEHSESFLKIGTRIDFLKVNLLKLLFFNYFPTRSVMLKRNIKYRFLPDKKYAEDYLLWLSIALDGHPVYYLDQQLSYSFKNDFGDSGLTSDLFKTHRGVIDTYRQLLNQHKISTLVFSIAVFFAQIKLLRRYIIVFFRKIIITLQRFFWSS